MTTVYSYYLYPLIDNPDVAHVLCTAQWTRKVGLRGEQEFTRDTTFRTQRAFLTWAKRNKVVGPYDIAKLKKG